MILACPACATRFQVDAAALAGAAGRRLRCARCGNVWRHADDAPPLIAAPASPAAEPLRGADRHYVAALDRTPPRLPSVSETLAIEALGLDGGADAAAPSRGQRHNAPVLRADGPTVPRLDAPPPRDGATPARSAAARRTWPVAAGLGLAALAAAIVLVAFLARDRVAAIWPGTAPAPAVADIAPPSGTGLKVTLSPRRTSDALVIDGAIVNKAAVVRRIPRLRVTLRDRHETALASQVIDPPVVRLAPGASAHFNAVFEHPSVAATGVAVTFATD